MTLPRAGAPAEKGSATGPALGELMLGDHVRRGSLNGSLKGSTKVPSRDR